MLTPQPLVLKSWEPIKTRILFLKHRTQNIPVSHCTNILPEFSGRFCFSCDFLLVLSLCVSSLPPAHDVLYISVCSARSRNPWCLSFGTKHQSTPTHVFAWNFARAPPPSASPPSGARLPIHTRPHVCTRCHQNCQHRPVDQCSVW